MNKSFYSFIFLNVFVCFLLTKCNNYYEKDKNVIGYFSVDIGDFDRFESVISVSLDAITHAPDSVLTLYFQRHFITLPPVATKRYHNFSFF